MARKIEVADYDPEWERMFRTEAKAIKAILGKNCVTVQHIGSTAVKGLRAKPIIDIMPVVKDLSLVDARNTEFEALGYECMGEFGIPERRFYRKGGDQCTHHIHVFAQSNTAEINRHIAVRDYLRSNKDAADEYAALKTRLAAEFPDDSDGYCNGKNAFVKNMEQKALVWKKQQEHQASCMSMGMCFGCAIGCALGSAFGNIGIGMCLGVSIGMSLGLAIGAANKKG